MFNVSLSNPLANENVWMKYEMNTDSLYNLEI